MEIKNFNQSIVKKVLASSCALIMVASFAGCNNDVKIDEELASSLSYSDGNFEDMNIKQQKEITKTINESLYDVIPPKVAYIDDYDISSIAENTLRCDIKNIGNDSVLNLIINNPNEFLFSDIEINNIKKVISSYKINSITITSTDFKNDFSKELLNELLISNDDFQVDTLNIYDCENIKEIENLEKASQIKSLNIINESLSKNQEFSLKKYSSLNNLVVENNPSLTNIDSLKNILNIELNDYQPEYIKNYNTKEKEKLLIKTILSNKVSLSNKAKVLIKGFVIDDLTFNNKNIDLVIDDCEIENDILNINIETGNSLQINYKYQNLYNNTININGNKLNNENIIANMGDYDSVIINNDLELRPESFYSLVINNNTLNYVTSEISTNKVLTKK
ncbi:MAG: hypothetical protein ACI4OT_01730 [Bacilli bacterium]